ncbi:alpha-glucuronidase family glycosyl hydrolase [Oceanobacillus chungangensis]|uniref:alpha-glucuronidase family glycosyl hydrolase n=1 Tax=Oceanobacillus chungangensis TaxID=1229152 RepID=UPI001472C5D7|nr:alpha-glucuronidase family glycosyl hydrolase [Oceanobacillus chungangensis]
MNSIIYFNNHVTIKFAVEELRRLMKKAGLQVNIYQNPDLNTLKESKRISIMLQDEFNSSSFSKGDLFIEKDGFAIFENENETWIIGKEERSTLYGVYHFCEKRLGYNWFSIGEEHLKESNFIQGINNWNINEPAFNRRGNILETINDPIYISKLIDWGVKNGLNEFFFTFFLWDEIGEYIREDLEKRSVNVTLGGHSLRFLLVAAERSSNESVGFFIAESPLQNQVIEEIVNICKKTPVVTRISLWPEDIGIEEDHFSDFMQIYIVFAERLKTALKAEKLRVEVEHIVYNAGLAWNMLERNEKTVPTNQVDILYAYWGRDYSQSIDNNSTEQTRAINALKDWKKQTEAKQRSITVLEYYSDHFMLSELFPPLVKRIEEDVKAYRKLKIDGLLNLIVPIHEKEQSSEMPKKYPWKWIQQLNNYFYAGLSWGKNGDQLLRQFGSMLGPNNERYVEILLELEKIVSQHTKWNFPLFPARVVDPEKVSHPNDATGIIEFLDEIILFFNKQDIEIDKDLLMIQNKNNAVSFSNQEMLLIYFYYLKETAKFYKKAWTKMLEVTK